MNWRRTIDVLMCYIPFALVLFFYVMSLFRDAAIIANEMDRNVHILTDVLMINAIIGEMGCLLVIDRFSVLLTGKKVTIGEDIREKSSEDVAVKYNGVIASSFIFIMLSVVYVLYKITEWKLLLNISGIVVTVFCVGLVAEFLGIYFKSKNESREDGFSNLPSPEVLPMVICIIQFFVLREKWVGFIYRNICNPKNDISLVLLLIFVMCYFLAIAFCHFYNVYCIIGFWFARRDVGKIQRKNNLLQKKEEVHEKSLRQTTRYVDEKAEQVGFIGRRWLAIYFCFVHVKIYIQERIYTVVYVLSFIRLEIIKHLNGLLEPERIKVNTIRFCGVTAVLELLALDMVLFIYLESNDPCLKFFELLSTVIIIPVLLSWLSELKSKKGGKNQKRFD